jgi:hypothetical protein
LAIGKVGNMGDHAGPERPGPLPGRCGTHLTGYAGLSSARRELIDSLADGCDEDYEELIPCRDCPIITGRVEIDEALMHMEQATRSKYMKGYIKELRDLLGLDEP